jgi:hypothetical protein
MRLFVIDTTERANQWKIAVPDAILVADEGFNQSSFLADDIIMAHAHYNYSGNPLPPDFVVAITQEDHQVGNAQEIKIKQFRQELINSAAKGAPLPLLILYSGDLISSKRAEEWKAAAIENALPKYTKEYIQVITSRQIGRYCKPEELRELLPTKYFNTGSAAGIFTVFDINTNLQAKEYSKQAVLAMRLLCEAWMFVKNKETSNGIIVRAPENPVDWFLPFDPTLPSRLMDKTKEDKKRTYMELANLVVGFMGDARNEAEQLLTAVVNKDDPESHVENFLKKFAGTKQGDTNPAA